MPRESLLGITPEQSNESLGNLLDTLQGEITGVSEDEIKKLNKQKMVEWIRIDQSIERNTEKFVDYRRRAESDSEAVDQIAELEREQKALQERAKELVAEFVTELKTLRETESAREEATAVEPAKENKEKQRLLNEAERIKGELSKLFAEVTEYRENLEREFEMLDGLEDERTKRAAEETKRVIREVSHLNNFRDRKRNLEGEHAEFKTALSKLDSSEKADFNRSEDEIAGLSVNISDEIDEIEKLEKKIESSRRTKRATTPAPGSSPVAAALGSSAGIDGKKEGPIEGGPSVLDGVDVPHEPAIYDDELAREFPDDPEEREPEEVSDARIERTESVGDDEERLIPPDDVVLEVPIHTEVAESPVIDLVDGLDKTTATTINEALKSIDDIAVRKEAKKILSDAFRGLDKEKNWQMFSILELFSYQRELPEQIVSMKSRYGEEKLVEKLKIMVDRASHMLRMIESDPEKAELAGRTTVEMAEKLHKWCDEHGLKGTFFADDEEKYKTSMYWDIAKYDGAVHGGLAITDANPEKKVYKSIADLKKAQFVKDGAMDVGHPDRLTEDELKEIVARCYFDASPLDKNTEAKLRQELSVARMKMWFEEEHEKEEYREEHGGSLDGFEYSFTKKLREADEMAKAEKEGVAILVKELDAANREKKEVSLEAPLVPGAIKRTRVELRKNATDTKRETAEHGRALLLVLETWVKKQYAKDQRELEFAELQRRWDGAGVEDWILEVKAAEEKKARAKFDGIKKRISEAEQRAKKNRTDAVSLQSIIDMAHGGSLTRDQYSKAIASLSREMKQDQWRGSPEFRSSGKDETERLVDFAKRVVLEVERAAKVEEDRAEELKNELTEFQSYDWAREKAAKAATGDHPEKDGAHPVTDKAEHPTEAGGHDDHAESKKHPAIEKLDNAGHGHGHEKEEKKLPEFETIPYEAIPDRPEPGADDPKVFFSGWEYSHRKVTRAFWKSDVVQSEYDKMKDEQKIRLANTLSMLRAEGSTTSAAYYETPDPYFKKGYKKEKTKRSGKEDKPKEEKITGVLEPRPYGLKVPELAKIYDSLVKPGENGEKQKAIFWTQIPSSNVPGREGERQLFLISLHTADNKLGKGQPVKFYLDVKKDVAQRVNALLTHDANNAIHIVRGLSKAYGYERFADVPFEQGQTMHAQVQWSGPKKKLEVAPPLPPKPKPGEPVSHSRRNFLAVVGLAGGAYVAGRVGRPHVARVWRKRKTRSEDENNLEGDLQNVREYREGDAKFAPHYTAEQLEASLDRISAGELESLYGQKIEDPKTFLRARLQQIFNRSAIPMASGALSIGEKSEVSGVKYFEQFKKDKPKIIAAVLEASKRHGVPADVIFGVLVKESRGYRGAVSNRGAKGLMQVIDGTATKDLGWTQSDWEKNWQQIRPNIDTGAKYLKILDRQFGGRKDLVFAAYNGGPTGVLNMIERYAKDVLHKENIFDKDRSKRNIVNARALKFIEDNHINMLLIYEYYRVKRGMKENDLPETMAYVFAVDALTVGAPAKWMGEEIKQAEKNKQQEASSSPDSGVSSVDGGNNNVEKPEEDRLIIEENPDEEVPTIDLTSTSTSVESDSILDIEDTRTTNTSTQTDARLSRRDLLRGRKSEKAAEAPKGLSSDGQWAKGLVSGLDKFSDEKMSRSEKDKLMAEISSAEAKFDAFKKDKKIRSKEDYKALVEAAESLKAKMQWADFKLNIGYVGRGNIREIDKKITFFKEKAK